MIEVNNRLSLLCRNWKLPICLAAITYLVVQLSMIHAHLFAVHLTCTAPDFSSWTWHVNFIETISFCVVIAIQIGHLALKSIPLNEFGSYVTTFFVSLLAGISSLIKLCTDWTGNCEDIFGVRLSGELWAEWIACVPFLYFIVLATDTKSALSRTDVIIIILITMVFIFGMCVHLTHSFGLSIFLLVTTVSFYIIGSVLFYFVTVANRDYFTRTQFETAERNVYATRLKQTQVQLAVCLLVILPLYPFVYFLSLFRVVDHDFTYAFITMLNVTAKLIFCTVMNSAHHSVMNDVVRLRLAEETLALRAETAANESRRQFVRYIMHEVRVPLSSITMGLGYLQHRSNNDNEEEAKEALLMMEGATGFMKQTLNDVLNMQRIEEGKLELDFADFSIEKAVYRVKATLQGLIKEKQVNLIVAIHPGVPEMVIGDGFRIEHVLVNLVSNALKFSQPHSEVTIDIGVAFVETVQLPQSNNSNSNNNNNNNCNNNIINDNSNNGNNKNDNNNDKTNRNVGGELSSIRTSNSNNNSSRRFRFPSASNLFSKGTVPPPTKRAPTSTTTVIFSVMDTGRGISKHDMKTLFRPFSQIRPHELQSGGGSGIGLVICKQIVELHGGTITCQSKLGVGTTFTFYIPFEVVVATGEGGEGSGEGEDLYSADGEWSSSRPRPGTTVDISNSPKQHKHHNTPSLTVQTQTLPHKTNKATRDPSSSRISRFNTHHNLIPNSRQSSGRTSGRTMLCSDDDDVSVASGRSLRVKSNAIDKFHSKANEDNTDNFKLGLKNHEELRSSSSSTVKVVPYTSSLLPSTSHRSTETNSSSTSSKSNINNRNVINDSSNKSSNRSSNKNSNNHNSKSYDDDDKMELFYYDSNKIETNNISNRDSSSDNLLSAFQLDPVLMTVASPTSSATASAAVDPTKRTVLNHVLLVDDVTSNRRILSMLLRQRGIASTMAVNGLEGVKAVTKGSQTFDLIFMDNSMPVMTGVEATKQLRAFGYSHLIIGVTGNALEEDVDEYIEAGADAVILKPVTVLQINQILVYAETHGNTHVSDRKIVFTDTHYIMKKI